MVFDRITLIEIYKTLKLVNDFEGDIVNILLSKNNKYNKKLVPKFKTLDSLKLFINSNYPFVINTECQCLTNNESFWRILKFEIQPQLEYKDFDIINENNRRKVLNIQPISRYNTIVSNINGNYNSSKSNLQNKLIIKKITNLFNGNLELTNLFNNYSCFSYIEPNYIENQCDYIEIFNNKDYIKILENY